VVITVFSAAQGGRGAIDSIFFDVATSFERHKVQIPFLGYPSLSTENKDFVAGVSNGCQEKSEVRKNFNNKNSRNGKGNN
jgi:hypothetical protein